MRRLTRIAVVLLITAHGSVATADRRVVPTASLGLFMEFGDQAGIAGGFALWVGASFYPDVDPDTAQTTSFAAAGVELRTGMIPVLTGPNELSPQLRAGVAFLGGADFLDNDSSFDNLTFPKSKIYAIAGYRWVSAFGLDNLEGKRKSEQALRLGLGAQSLALVEAADPVPTPNGIDLFADVNLDWSLDRYGFDVNLGF